MLPPAVGRYLFLVVLRLTLLFAGLFGAEVVRASCCLGCFMNFTFRGFMNFTFRGGGGFEIVVEKFRSESNRGGRWQKVNRGGVAWTTPLPNFAFWQPADTASFSEQAVVAAAAEVFRLTVRR